jgi:hypothetical protein
LARALRALALPLVIAVATTVGLFLRDGRTGISLADGGYLWYAAVHTAQGELPIRDFQGYDPGRNYWMAAFVPWLGPGLVAVRQSTAVFQALGLALALAAARAGGVGPLALALLGGAAAIWMFPWFKVYEAVFALAGVGVAAELARRPSLARHCLAGLFVGVAAAFGRNLGAYAAAGLGLLALHLHRLGPPAPQRARLAAAAAGVAVGFAPVVALCLFVRGFAASYLDSALQLVALGSTNVSLPVPWPWAREAWPAIDRYPLLSWRELWPWYFFSASWVALPLAAAVLLVLALRTRPAERERRALLLGCAFAAPPWLHYAFSRADAYHVGPALVALLPGLAALPVAVGPGRRRAAGRLALGAGLALVAGAGLGLRPYHVERPGHEHRWQLVGSDWLRIPVRTGTWLRSVERTFSRFVPPGEPLLILPSAPALYVILGLDAPIWELYASIPPPPRRAAELVPTLEAKGVDWVLLADVAVDDREDLRLRATHPEFWLWFEARFEPVEEAPPLRRYRLYRRRSRRPGTGPEPPRISDLQLPVPP